MTRCRILGVMLTPVLVLTLSACSGSSSATPPVYHALSSTTGGDSTLAGTAGRVDPNTDAAGLQTTSGTVTHANGALSLTDDQFTFTDADGPDADMDVGYVNGTDRVTQISTALISQTYDFVQPYQQTYTHGGKVYRSSGVFGVVTSAGDVPTSGTATYTGQGAVFVKDNLGIDQAERGSTSTTVAANFGSGSVDVTMSGINGSAGGTQDFDEITATGMTISGNSFTGGAIDVTNGGGSVLSNITGPGITTTGGGHFFGYDASASGPDEAAGTLVVDGLEGSVIAVFAAD